MVTRYTICIYFLHAYVKKLLTIKHIINSQYISRLIYVKKDHLRYMLTSQTKRISPTSGRFVSVKVYQEQYPHAKSKQKTISDKARMRSGSVEG